MVKMAYGLPFKHDDHTTAINLINAQLEKINAQKVFAREKDGLEMIIILHAARVDSGNGETLDLELLLNQIGGIFKPMRRHQKRTIHYKQHYLPKFVKLISKIWEQQHMIAMGPRSFRNQDLQRQNNRIFLS